MRRTASPTYTRGALTLTAALAWGGAGLPVMPGRDVGIGAIMAGPVALAGEAEAAPQDSRKPAGTLAAAAEDWELLGTSHGVTVYRRPETGSDVVSVKGVGVIQAPVAQVFEAIIDNAHAHEWMPMVDARRDVRNLDPDTRIEYTHIQMPWPLTDRYVVARSHVDRLPDGTYQLSTQSVDEPDVRDPGRILAQMHFSRIVLKPTADGATAITIELNSDPKGSVPKWLVNMFQKNWPREFIGNLAGFVQRRAQHGLAH